MNHIYVTNHTYVQFKVAKGRLSGLLMLLLLFFHFLFCVGASFLIIIISQYCGHLSKQEVNYMGVCLCHCVTIFFTARHWFGQPKYSTHIKTFLRCTGFCLYFLHFIYVKPVRSPLIQRTPAGSSFRLLAQTFYNYIWFTQSVSFQEN